jgi:hypothetical protein
VKEYLFKTLGIDPDVIEPNGRFVHGSRHIGLAVYALANQFDTEALRDLAYLMRHTSATAERYYSLWTTRQQNERAALRFSRSVGQDREEATEEEETRYRPATLAQPNSSIRHFLKTLFGSEKPAVGESLETVGGLCDASTQTGEEEKTIVTREPRRSPLCQSCHSFTTVLGPIGLRRHLHFGCYYTQCTQCHGRRPGKFSSFYSSGFTPPCRSHSNKPRKKNLVLVPHQEETIIQRQEEEELNNTAQTETQL